MKIFSVLFHRVVGRMLSCISGLYFARFLSTYKDGFYFVLPKPVYVSQLAGAGKGKTKGDGQMIYDDKAAKLFGAKNIESFSYWAWRACGIVGVEMILRTLLGKDFDKKTMELIDEGLLLGGYDVKNDVGWYHKALLELGRKYGVDGRLAKFVSSEEIASIVLSGDYVLASIFSSSGGHLLLIYGIKIQKGRLISFVVHDPYDLKVEGKDKEVSKKDFDKLSTRRIIVFASKNHSCDRVDL